MPTNEEDLFAQLTEVFEAVDKEGVENLQLVDTYTLLTRVSDLTDQLMALKQALRPHTQEARDIHSARNACQVELRRRGIKI